MVPMRVFHVDARGMFSLSGAKDFEDSAAVAADVRRALAGEVFTSEVEAAGVEWEVRYEPVRDEKGIVTGVVGVGVDVGARRRVRAEALRSLWFLNAIVENIPSMIFVKDAADLRFVLFNRAGEELLGYSREQLLGKNDYDFFPKREADGFIEKDRAVLAQGVVLDIPREIIHTRLHGERILHTRKITIHDEEGRPAFLLGISRDVTELSRLEDEARKSQARFSGIVSTSSDAIISIDESQSITLFNAGAEGIFGYSSAEAVGAPLDVLIPERLRALHRQHVEAFAVGSEVARSMGARGTSIMGLRKNGEEFPADAAISKLEVGGQKVLTVILRDVTEKVRAESALRVLAEAGSEWASTLDYEGTLANIARVAARYIADVAIVDVVEESGAIRRLRVVSREPSKDWACDLLSQLPIDLGRPHPIRARLAAGRSVLIPRLSAKTLDSLSQSEEHLRALRGIDARSLVAVPLLAHGKLFGMMAFVSSTPSRVYGPADVRFAEDLAARAALSIENARLYRGARRASQLRDDILGIVAHDLRNPLGTILLQAAVLRRLGGTSRESAAPAVVIERAATRMNHLIRDLLDVTRIDAGQLSVEQVRVSLAQVISEFVEAQRPLTSSVSLGLRLDVGMDLPEVWADPDRLHQVFENLIGNAVKFTAPGGLITVGASPGEGEVVTWVADTGVGIAAESLPYVFDRFWQEARANRQGAGLGLAIVKGIVAAHGGRVWVESTLGRGSAFYFTIPTAAARRAAA
jgi:PAS domain S-box-containing protein